MRSSRVPQALTCGLAALLATSCSGDPAPPAPEPEAEPAPIPTAFEGQSPPGIEGEVLRFLHGDEADAHAVFADPLGVRISSVGDAFLISSGGADQHLLQEAATGADLWEGEARFRGFGTDVDGAPVLLMSDLDGSPFVLDAEGATLWEPAVEGDLYLGGVGVRRPEEWSPEEAHGEYTVLAADGTELWTYDFAAPEEPEEEDAEADEDADRADEEEPEDTEEPPALGVPVAAWADTVLLASGDSTLHARSLDPDDPGAELWDVDAGEDEDLGLSASGSLPEPSVLGLFPLPEPEEGPEEDAPEHALVIRWSGTEAPSVLSAHDPADGDLLWTLEEPGPNPVGGPFDPAGPAGGLYDTATGTFLLPQASGAATAVAIDLAAGEVRWGLEEEGGAFSPAFTHAGYVYGAARGGENDSQVVLDALDMNVVADDLSAHVEAVTAGGHAILVQDRQRFVYGPPPQDDEDTGEPTEDPSESPSDEAS
ncbi:outer membrane protein assembly factor BamB family protein [Nocardiopsis lambiniae]|uniref:PQQ-binding-like beta-propeller repeat protein n=1 Tax=Nocardiopsis lambiniae TaxID=3075539 RepID=A0ABU2M649_9ACTN|nr:PQQ-binding-like beta-propeller repeat protein [Nocardiopsis sp. DSM 44743]MDT0328127.1 PQQ-binding-like beta-propeller repeat protein [Nocardiopsis sp. DSM 44743]